MTDSFRRHSRSLTAPPEQGVAVVPSDTAELAAVTRALYVGGAGDLAVVMAGGGEVVLAAVPAGTLLPMRVTRVRATGTTATRVVGLW
ncbi:MAG TPA: hypothetical protein VM891_05915 [Amaricoccus sp.]|nr:hypothetical protein [Amaricoccus sp.]